MIASLAAMNGSLSDLDGLCADEVQRELPGLSSVPPRATPRTPDRASGARPEKRTRPEKARSTPLFAFFRPQRNAHRPHKPGRHASSRP